MFSGRIHQRCPVSTTSLSVELPAVRLLRSPRGDDELLWRIRRARFRCEPARDPYMATPSSIGGNRAQPFENRRLCSRSAFLPSALW
eukprot:7869573-Heterocapsa_arctica.AAC.1